MLKGIVFVLLGAASYGVLATIVKLSYNAGYNVNEVTFSQYGIGFVVLWFITLLPSNAKTNQTKKPTKFEIHKLLLAGTSLGFTGLFYYSSVQYLDVSICIVLLMQSVWMGVVLEAILDKKRPENNKVWAIVMVLVGTIFATKAYSNFSELSPIGLLWGFLAALSYTVSLYAANRVGLGYTNSLRSALMMSGGFSVIVVALLFSQHGSFNWSVFFPWGLYLAIFGTILPPILLNKGFPITGIGIGSVLVSLEIPVSVAMAVWLLHETVVYIQILGILLILLGIVVLNGKRILKRKTKIL